jgi:hypothetical protein
MRPISPQKMVALESIRVQCAHSRLPADDSLEGIPLLRGTIAAAATNAPTPFAQLFVRQRQNPGYDSLEALEQARITFAGPKVAADRFASYQDFSDDP